MNNDFIDIDEFAKLVNKSTSTIRRNIKNLSEKDKYRFIRRVPVIGSGGEKILLSKSWISNFAKHEQASESLENDQQNNDSIIEILRGQLAIKDTQISSLSEANKELIERLKEVNYTLANTQKQLSAPNEHSTAKWWQFWK
jgi:hypothetical protein